MPESVPNHLAKAILVTLFCCLPFGIIAIVFASQVDGKVASGDLNGARQASDKSNFWSNLSIGLGLAGMVLYFLLIVVAGLAGA
jgi:hypothetical protein